MTTDSTKPFGAATDAKYVRLTTFRKDGTAIGSPLWAAADGDRLVMWTETDSWKVKRIRHDPHVVIQACDLRGRDTYGEAVDGTAEILDGPGTDRARSLITAKYGIVGKILVKASLLRRGKSGTIGLSVTANQDR